MCFKTLEVKQGSFISSYGFVVFFVGFCYFFSKDLIHINYFVLYVLNSSNEINKLLDWMEHNY